MDTDGWISKWMMTVLRIQRRTRTSERQKKGYRADDRTCVSWNIAGVVVRNINKKYNKTPTSAQH